MTLGTHADSSKPNAIQTMNDYPWKKGGNIDITSYWYSSAAFLFIFLVSLVSYLGIADKHEGKKIKKLLKQFSY
jgi:hypothetical protein